EGFARRTIDPHDGVRIEHGKKPLEVAGVRGPQKCLHNRALTSPVGLRWHRGAAHTPARSARELLGGGRRPSHDGSDLIEWQAEQIMQDERYTLGGRQ